MTGQWIKIAVSQLAVAGFGMAALLNGIAQADELPPVVSAQAAEQVDDGTLEEMSFSENVTNIPSVLTSAEAVQPVSFSMHGGCIFLAILL